MSFRGCLMAEVKGPRTPGGILEGCRICGILVVEPRKRCSRCKRVFYCSEKCQRSDWSARHKHECKSPSMEIITKKIQAMKLVSAQRRHPVADDAFSLQADPGVDLVAPLKPVWNPITPTKMKIVSEMLRDSPRDQNYYEIKLVVDAETLFLMDDLLHVTHLLYFQIQYDRLPEFKYRTETLRMLFVDPEHRAHSLYVFKMHQYMTQKKLNHWASSSDPRVRRFVHKMHPLEHDRATGVYVRHRHILHTGSLVTKQRLDTVMNEFEKETECKLSPEQREIMKNLFQGRGVAVGQTPTVWPDACLGEYNTIENERLFQRRRHHYLSFKKQKVGYLDPWELVGIDTPPLQSNVAFLTWLAKFDHAEKEKQFLFHNLKQKPEEARDKEKDEEEEEEVLPDHYEIDFWDPDTNTNHVFASEEDLTPEQNKERLSLVRRFMSRSYETTARSEWGSEDYHNYGLILKYKEKYASYFYCYDDASCAGFRFTLRAGQWGSLESAWKRIHPKYRGQLLAASLFPEVDFPGEVPSRPWSDSEPEWG